MGGSNAFKRYNVATGTLELAGERAEQHQEGRRAHDGRHQHLRPARRQRTRSSSATTSSPTPGRPWRPCRSTSRWGGSLTYVGGSIYALSGDGKKNFFRYNIAANSWTRPQGRRARPTPGNVADGGALTTDGTYIYAFQGKTNAFWRYDIAANTWTALAPFIAATNQGGALVFVPGVNPQGQFTSLTASRSLVVTGDTVKVTLAARLEHSGQQRRRGAARHDADGRRVVQQPRPGRRSTSADDDDSSDRRPVVYEWTCTVAAGATPGSLTFSDAGDRQRAGRRSRRPRPTACSCRRRSRSRRPCRPAHPARSSTRACWSANGQTASSPPVQTFIGQPILTIVEVELAGVRQSAPAGRPHHLHDGRREHRGGHRHERRRQRPRAREHRLRELLGRNVLRRRGRDGDVERGHARAGRQGHGLVHGQHEHDRCPSPPRRTRSRTPRAPPRRRRRRRRTATP